MDASLMARGSSRHCCAVAALAVWSVLGSPSLTGAAWPDPPPMPAHPVFESPVPVTASPDVIDTLPTLAVDRCGNVHIAYLGSYVSEGAPDGVARDVFYVNNIGGEFSAPIKVEVPTGYYSHGVTLAVDADGVAHIAFRRSDWQINVTSDDDLYYVNNSSGSFDSPMMVVDGDYSYPDPYYSAPNNPMLAAGPDGVIHLAFEAGSDVLYGDNVFYTNDGGTGTFADPIMVSGGMADPQTDDQIVFDFTMVLDGRGWPHFAFYGTPDWINASDDGVFYVEPQTAPLPSPSFAAPVAAFTGEYLLDVQGPALAIDSDGNAHIVFRQPFAGFGNPSLYHTHNAGGTFAAAAGLYVDGDAINGFAPWLEIDWEGHLHLAYKTGWPFSMTYANDITGSWHGVRVAEDVDAYSGYHKRHFALGPGGELDIVYGDTVTSDLLDFHIYFVAGNRDNAFSPCAVIFADGFETGGCERWSETAP